MFALFARRPLTAALAALAVASFGTAYAASDPPQRERASTTTRCCSRLTMR